MKKTPLQLQVQAAREAVLEKARLIEEQTALNILNRKNDNTQPTKR